MGFIRECRKTLTNRPPARDQLPQLLALRFLDHRMVRELADFCDPTGRLFLGVTALPFRKGVFAAGVAVDYERALPGSSRLPSGVSVTALGRVRIAR